MAAVVVPKPMDTISKCRLRLSLSVALGACLVSWLVIGETSPFADYFLWHVGIPNLWSSLHVFPYLLMMIVQPSFFEDVLLYGSVFLQWLLIGYVLARLVCRTGQGGAADNLSINPPTADKAEE